MEDRVRDGRRRLGPGTVALSLSNDGVDLPAASPKLVPDPRGVWRRLTKESVRASSDESVDGPRSLEEPQMATSERCVGKGDRAGLAGGCMALAVAAGATCVPSGLSSVCAAS